MKEIKSWEGILKFECKQCCFKVEGPPSSVITVISDHLEAHDNEPF